MKAYSRLSMLTRLKYVGVKTEDLIDIYKLYIRSIIEYCSVAFHSSLTIEQSDRLERIQRVCLRVILGEMYVGYSGALEMCGLETLILRRQRKCLNFSLKCVKHKRNSTLFPLNKQTFGQDCKLREKYHVNWARTAIAINCSSLL